MIVSTIIFLQIPKLMSELELKRYARDSKVGNALRLIYNFIQRFYDSMLPIVSQQLNQRQRSNGYNKSGSTCTGLHLAHACFMAVHTSRHKSGAPQFNVEQFLYTGLA